MPNGEQYDEPTEGPTEEGSDQTTWIVGGIVVLVLIGAIVFFFWGNGEEQPATTPTDEEPAQMAAEQPDTPVRTEPRLERPTAVSEYARLARKPYQMPEGREKFKHDYTAKRLKALGDALVAFTDLLENPVNLQDVQSTLREKSQAIQKDWKDRHSDDVRAAFLAATRGFETLSENVNGMDGKVGELRSRAEAIDGDVLYLEQKSKAEAFFSKTADLFDSLFERLKSARTGSDTVGMQGTVTG